MKLHIIKLGLLYAVAITVSGNTLAATQKYITDEFEVTMRSGTSTANDILRLLKSGEAVSVLEEDLDTQYSFVELDDGKKGYILNRYLVSKRSAKDRLAQLEIKAAEQQEANAILQFEIKNLQTDLDKEQSDGSSAKAALLATENKLTRITKASRNTLSIVDENDELKSIVDNLVKNNAILSKKNATLKDSSNMDWFIRGAGVSLAAFVLGIIITRIRWRKQESWGSY